MPTKSQPTKFVLEKPSLVVEMQESLTMSLQDRFLKDGSSHDFNEFKKVMDSLILEILI